MAFDVSELGRNIRVRRAMADMTQGELAKAAGLSIGTIVKYENGDMAPGADKLFDMADALGCTPNDLLGWRADERTR